MGADFLLLYIPYPKMTEERKTVLKELVSSLVADDFVCGEDFDDEELEYQKDSLIGYIDDFDVLDHYRDTSVMYPCPDGVCYLATGGMSWGDAPTDSYSTIEAFINVDKVIDLLMVFAKEDAVIRRSKKE